MKLSMIAQGWFSLAFAIVFGVLGTISLKISHGLSYLKPTIALAIFYTASFVALTFAMKYIELSVVYAVWSGVGTVLISAVGFFYFKESMSLRKIIFLMLIIIGVIGMHVSDGLT